MATLPKYGGEQFGHRADQYLPPGNWQGVPGGFGGQLFTPNNPALGIDRGIGSDPRIVQAPDAYGNQFRAQWAPGATNRFAAGNWDPGVNPDEWDAGREARLQKRNAGYIAQGGPAPVPPGYPGVPLGPGNTGGQYNPPGVASAQGAAPRNRAPVQASMQAMQGGMGRTSAQATGQFEGQMPNLAPPGAVGPGGSGLSTQVQRMGSGWGAGGFQFDTPSDDRVNFGASLGGRGDQGGTLQRALNFEGFGPTGAYAHAPAIQQFSRASVDPRIAAGFSPEDQRLLTDYASGFNQRWGGQGQGQGLGQAPVAASPGADAGVAPAGVPRGTGFSSRADRYDRVAANQAQNPTARGQARMGQMQLGQLSQTLHRQGFQFPREPQAQQGMGYQPSTNWGIGPGAQNPLFGQMGQSMEYYGQPGMSQMSRAPQGGSFMQGISPAQAMQAYGGGGGLQMGGDALMAQMNQQMQGPQRGFGGIGTLVDNSAMMAAGGPSAYWTPQRMAMARGY